MNLTCLCCGMEFKNKYKDKPACYKNSFAVGTKLPVLASYPCRPFLHSYINAYIVYKFA